MQGAIGDHEGTFAVGIGKVAQAKHAFRVGDLVSGAAEPVADPRLEPVAYYKAAKLRIIAHGTEQAQPPPWLGPPPALETYRARGHRRLDVRTYAAKCTGCLWAV